MLELCIKPPKTTKVSWIVFNIFSVYFKRNLDTSNKVLYLDKIKTYKLFTVRKLYSNGAKVVVIYNFFSFNNQFIKAFHNFYKLQKSYKKINNK